MSHYIYINGLDDSESPYNIFRCGVCGIPWSEHPIGCPNHYNKSKYLQSLKYVLSDPQYSNLVALAVRNGFDLAAASAEIARLPVIHRVRVPVDHFAERVDKLTSTNGSRLQSILSWLAVILSMSAIIILVLYEVINE
jgi:hypothetical protein